MNNNFKISSSSLKRAAPKRLLIFIIILSFSTSVTLLKHSNLYAGTKKQIEFAADHPPYLEDFIISTEGDSLCLSLKVANPFDHKIKSLLLNGVSQKISLTVKVSVNSFNLYLVKFNRTLSDNTYTHNIDYDNLKKLFTVTLSADNKQIETTSYKKALKIAAEFKDIILLNKNQVDADRNYQVDTQTEIREVSLPFHLEYLFFFLSAWDRKSNSYTIDIPKQLLIDNFTR